MGDGFAFFDIILFALLAGYLVFKLRNVLGKRTGHEERHTDPFSPAPERPANSDNVIKLPDREHETVPGDQENGELSDLMRVKMADPSFDEIEFLKGARTAFEWIVEAFAKGDLDGLRPLLGDDLMSAFAGAVEEREKAGESQETTISSFRSALINDVTLAGSVARVTVEFITDQVKVTHASDGSVVDGDPDRIETVTDLWTFERDISSRDPNWRLVATGVPEDE
ncbi:Tim44/TimA family putative adaptor protein [Nisaea acidiphila]|uniref:Tim44/TimA family putative adaptor protein n=1 Tax=Nisaea acidiphila TaxID=1862145 RepID=A0A9J7AY28_9PROT|nr:Tim44/TimA family putative adaptor protein [Nisaea acidiphila]UUX52184.1 Tim44/TimA family putative adaptor protein [Nisaea acidiphila]